MFTWNEIAALGLLNILGDPELVIYFMKILKPLRRDCIEDEAREWHSSLRVSQQERWERIAKLSRERKFSAMNASVPITCTLPFDGGMWRNSKELLKMIRYFREGFIRRPIDYGQPEPGVSWPATYRTVEEDNSMKIKIVNLLKSETIGGNWFRSWYGLAEINEALSDLIECYQDEYWELRPYISLDRVGEGLPIRKLPPPHYNPILWDSSQRYSMIFIKN